MTDNVLLNIIEDGLEHSIHKWTHYLDIYHRYFGKFRDNATPENKVRILEIGVENGGSLDLWNKYFGADRCEIVGMDITPDCLRFARDNISILIGSQEDKNFLINNVLTLPMFDIIIDDGGHTMTQQIITFDVLYSHVKPGGIYLCEDTHTSYWQSYGGGLYNPNNFIEYTKPVIDKLTGYHYDAVDNFTKTCFGIYYHDSMVFFEKAAQPILAPRSIRWPAKPIAQ